MGDAARIMKTTSHLPRIKALDLEMPERVLELMRDLAMNSGPDMAKELWAGLKLYGILER